MKRLKRFLWHLYETHLTCVNPWIRIAAHHRIKVEEMIKICRCRTFFSGKNFYASFAEFSFHFLHVLVDRSPSLSERNSSLNSLKVSSSHPWWFQFFQHNLYLNLNFKNSTFAKRFNLLPSGRQSVRRCQKNWIGSLNFRIAMSKSSNCFPNMYLGCMKILLKFIISPLLMMSCARIFPYCSFQKFGSFLLKMYVIFMLMARLINLHIFTQNWSNGPLREPEV